jgi:hypothetical protein
MPETTSAINACNVALHLDNSSGVPVDISGSANRVEPQFSQQIGEYQVFGGAWLKRLVCKKDATLNLQIVYSTAANEGWKILKDWWQNHNDEPRTVRFMVPEEEIGADDFSGEFLISTMNAPFDGTQAGPVLVALTLLQTGGLNIGTVAT